MDFGRARLTQERWFTAIRWLLVEALFLQVRPEVETPRVFEARFQIVFLTFAVYTLLVTILVALKHQWPTPLSYFTAAVDTILAVGVATLWSTTLLSPGLVGVAATAIAVGMRRFHIFDTFVYSLIIEFGLLGAHFAIYGNLLVDEFDLVVLTAFALLPVLARAVTLVPSPNDEQKPFLRLSEGAEKALDSMPAESESTAQALYPTTATALAQFAESDIAGVLVQNSDDGADLYTVVGGQTSKEHLPAPSTDQLAGRLLAIREPSVLTRRDNLTTRGLPDQYPPRLDNLVAAPLRAVTSHGAVLFAANRKNGPFGVPERLVATLLATEAARLKLAYDFASDSSQSLMAAADALLAAAEAKRPGSRIQAEESARFAVAIARELGWDDRKLEDIALASLLHDVGQIAIPDYLLDKVDPLQPEEFEIVKQHPRIAARIIDPLNRSKVVLDAIYSHHERWDGRGYPSGLTGEEIPEGARVLSLAHAMDAMLSPKPYRAAMGPTEALQEVILASGTQFDPTAVQAFLAVLKREGESFLQHRDEASPRSAEWSGYRGS